MTGRCETCRHWQPITAKLDPDAWPDVSGVALPFEMAESFFPRDPVTHELQPRDGPPVGRCASPLLRFCEAPAANGASTYDGSGYMGGLVTGHAFGCVNHEVKP